VNELSIRQQRRTVRVLPLAVKHWRTIHLGWTQKQLASLATETAMAKAAGVTISPSTIAMIETGERQPSLVVAEAIAEAMGIQLGAFGERLDVPAGQGAA
jgi:transcriptional regulator with XRE-family HTH domain